jgi:hypothetical protein
MYFLAGNSNSHRKFFYRHIFQKIKDDYSEKFVEISRKVQSGLSYLDEVLAEDMS